MHVYEFSMLKSAPTVSRAGNREREHPVPWSVITRLLTRWTLPSLLEAHQVDYFVTESVTE